MNKGIWISVIVLLCAAFCVANEQGYPLVSGICLVENEVYHKGLPPGKITIGFEVRTDVLFKISFEDRVVHAGQFRKGFNTIALPSPDFFRRTDSHSFILECKSDESTVSKEIVIDIRLIPLYIVQKSGEKRRFGGELQSSSKIDCKGLVQHKVNDGLNRSAYRAGDALGDAQVSQPAIQVQYIQAMLRMKHHCCCHLHFRSSMRPVQGSIKKQRQIWNMIFCQTSFPSASTPVL